LGTVARFLAVVERRVLRRVTFDRRLVAVGTATVSPEASAPCWRGRAGISIELSREVADELMRTARSIHFHVWTSNEFLELLEHCRSALGFPFEVVVFERTGHEVVAVLEKT